MNFIKLRKASEEFASGTPLKNRGEFCLKYLYEKIVRINLEKEFFDYHKELILASEFSLYLKIASLSKKV